MASYKLEKATEKLTAHFSTAKYHMEAMELASNFLSVMNNNTPSIIKLIPLLHNVFSKTELYLNLSLIQLFYVANKGSH